MHRDFSMRTSPSSGRLEIAPVGQAAWHAGVPQCMHGVGTNESLPPGRGFTQCTRVRYRPAGIPFSSLHALSHDLHPMHRSRSTMIVYWLMGVPYAFET